MQTSGQTAPIIEALKRQLKKDGKTYVDVANCLQLSQASVKRLFAGHDLSLKRLDAICTMLNIQIADLVAEMARDQYSSVSELSESQEREIAGDLGLLLVAVLVLNRWTFADIRQNYQFTEAETIRYLTRLDHLKLIELQPGNRIKLLVAPNFKWLDNGPIHQLFIRRIESEYFKSTFDKPTEQLLVLNGMLSEQSNRHFQRRLRLLAAEFDELSRDDARLPLAQRLGATVLLAVRDWNYEDLFGRIRRSKKVSNSDTK